ARERHGHRHGVHAVRRAVDLRAGGADACRRPRARGEASPAAGTGGGVMIVRSLFVALGGIVLAGAASAQTPIAVSDTLPLTLDDAVRRAVEHNPDLAV